MTSSELTVLAQRILKTARVANSRVNYTGFVAWKDRAQTQRAFDLYNTFSNGERPMVIGCAPCHSKVFNWLLSKAMADVPEEQPELALNDQHHGETPKAAD